MDVNDKRFLLDLAQEAIRLKMEGKNLEIDEEKITEPLKEKRGTFVTLKIDGNLRGCIGHLLPVQEIYRDVIENARAAAFHDPRFDPLSPAELEKIEIEISVLGPCQKMDYGSYQSLIDKLEKEKPGVILKCGTRGATFLPQVWEELPLAADFLSHLCLKAGLNPAGWKREVEIETYAVEKIS